MTIRLLEGIQLAGVHQAVGSILTLTPDLEAHHVSLNRAVYTTLPDIGDDSVPVMATKNFTGVIKESPRAGNVALFAPSSKYKFFIPGFQHVGSGAAKDKSGKGADAVIAAAYNDAAVWANKGYITIADGTEQYLTIPAAKITTNLNTQSFLVMFRINKSPAVQGTVMGCTDGTTLRGFGLVTRTTGKLSVRTAQNGSSMTVLTDTTAVVADSTDHDVAVLWDSAANTVSVWVDGTLSDTFSSAWTISAYTAWSRDLALGGNFQNAAQTSYACKLAGIHMLAWDGGAPSNIGLLAQKHAAAPNMYFTDADFVF